MSLRTRMLGSLLVLVGVVVFLVQGYWLPYRMAYEAARWERMDRQVLETLADALVEPLVSRNLAVVYELLDGQRPQHPHWQMVELTDDTNRRLYPLDEAEPERISPHWRWLTLAVADEDHFLGQIQVAVDYRPLLAESRHSLDLALALFLAILLGGVLLLAWLQDRWVRRPLTRLIQGISAFTREGEVVPLPEGNATEVDELLRSFAKMREVLLEREADIRFHRQRLRSLVDSIPDAILVVKEDCSIVDTNPAASRIFGHSRSSLMNSKVSTLIPEFHLPLFLARAKGSQEGTEEIRLRGVTAGQRDVALAVSVSAMGEEGERLYTVLARDITQQQEREDEIRRLLQEIEVTVSLVPGVVVRVNEGGLMSWWNERLLQLTDWDASVLSRRPFLSLVEEESQKAAREAIRQAQEGGEGEFQGRLVRHSGGETPAHLFRIRRLEEGNASLVVVGMDIEAQLATQDMLREARNQAQALARSRFFFLANMSHEIRTPLNGMLGMLELLRDHVAEEARDYLDTAERSGEHLMELLNDLLDLSKLESGELQLEEMTFHLLDQLEDLMALFSSRARGKGVELSWNLDSRVPEWVRGDRTRLVQVLSNLLSNAIKFTERGHVVLEVRQGPDEMVEFEVADTGIGIPEEVRAGILRPFQQASPDITRRFGGTGLGLSLVNQLVKRMGGRLHIHSRVGEGSRFVVSLPLPAALCASPSQDRPLAGLRVLVVDDLLPNRALVAHVVQEAGGVVHLAEGANEALERVHFTLADGKSYDVLVVDDDMPGMNGRTLLTRLADFSELSEARRILMLTHSSDPPPIEEGENLVYLHKPLRRIELLHALTSGEHRLHRPERSLPINAGKGFHGRVLLVEDNPVNRKVAIAFLKRLGLEVESADNGEAGVAAWEKGGFDLILMDIQMPLMDGYTATREIRAREEGTGRHIPIVALTANAMEGDEQRCREAGMDGYLTKPFKLEALEEMVGRWLRRPAEDADSRQSASR